jgi:ABC-type transport system involved in cytochrome c biogenesis ATPase subunit
VSENAPFGRLRHFEVKALFGKRDYEFDLDPKEPTILTGANGTGKSTLLRYINAIGTAQWDGLLKLPPFGRITLTFENGDKLRVNRQEERLRVSLTGEESWTYRPQVFVHYSKVDMSSEAAFQTRSGEWYIPQRGVALPPNVAVEAWQNDPSLLEALRTDPSLLEAWSTDPSLSESPNWVKELPARFPVLYVTDQRLIVDSVVTGREERRVTERVTRRAAVDAAARFIARRISRALSAYATESQRLDRDFPQRVVRAMGRKREIPDKELAELLQEVERERKSLQQVGLLTGEVISAPFEEARYTRRDVKPVIYTFANDTRQKFRTLYSLRERLSLFVEFLNQHYESKRVIIDQQKGFRIEVLGNGPQELLPSQLSSGEQQILVLAYQILFRADEGTLVLIDEPELSLHVLWQDTFIDDLTRMGAVAGPTFLLATHSPTLIGGREHLRRSLDPL